MKEKCTICGRDLDGEYRCPACSFDRRGDFVGLRTVSPVGKRDLYEHLVLSVWDSDWKKRRIWEKGLKTCCHKIRCMIYL